MNREILFKAKRKNWRELPKEEQWVEGYYVLCRKHHYILPAVDKNIGYDEREDEWVEIDPETLCQYTWLTDKNDTRIWENSVVKTSTGIVGKVIWHDETAGFCLLPENENDDFLLLSYWIEEYEIEVINNVFDNPQLLQEE